MAVVEGIKSQLFNHNEYYYCHLPIVVITTYRDVITTLDFGMLCNVILKIVIFEKQ